MSKISLSVALTAPGRKSNRRATSGAVSRLCASPALVVVSVIGMGVVAVAFAGERHQMGQFVMIITMKINLALTEFHGKISA